MQQVSDPKHGSKSSTECLKNNRIMVLHGSSKSQDLNLIEMLWWDLKRAVHNLIEWTKIQPRQSETDNVDQKSIT